MGSKNRKRSKSDQIFPIEKVDLRSIDPTTSPTPPQKMIKNRSKTAINPGVFIESLH